MKESRLLSSVKKALDNPAIVEDFGEENNLTVKELKKIKASLIEEKNTIEEFESKKRLTLIVNIAEIDLSKNDPELVSYNNYKRSKYLKKVGEGYNGSEYNSALYSINSGSKQAQKSCKVLLPKGSWQLDLFFCDLNNLLVGDYSQIVSQILPLKPLFKNLSSFLTSGMKYDTFTQTISAGDNGCEHDCLYIVNVIDISNFTSEDNGGRDCREEFARALNLGSILDASDLMDAEKGEI